jgi:NAD(P)-dependent dehydrogenase (short-subunit alcohol dehydrogenase family)
MKDGKGSAKPVCVVVGVGPGNGAAFARRFAAEGFAVALMARRTELIRQLASSLGARAYACDVSDAASVQRAFAAVRKDLGEVDVLIYNAGSGVWGTVEDVSAADFEMSWRVNTLGAFLASKEVIPAMKAAKHGTIVFIGATASRRGNVKTAAFAPAKAAQRSLAESMARHLWPSGVHVAVVIVDGVVDLATTRAHMPGKPDTFFIKPDDVAESVFLLTQQKPSVWSFEVEARPFGETW